MDLHKASETLSEQNPHSLSNEVPCWETFLEDRLQKQAMFITWTH